VPISRAETIERLTRIRLDLAVVGGGIVGARIALEAARLGLRVGLFEAGDFGGGTSGASSKLVHGGFRYLAMGDIALVRRSQRERWLLAQRIAPNLVRPVPMLLPVYGDSAHGPATVAAGLVLYRSLAGHGGRIALLDAGRARRAVPPLRVEGLRMCGVFDEAQTVDVRLVLATVKGAALAGALVLNHARVTGLDLVAGRRGAVCVDAGPDGTFEVVARHVVNATGPWVDHVRRLDRPAAPPLVRLSKGVHVLLDLPEPWRAGVAMPLPDGRVCVGVPWQGMLLLGTTDTLYEGDPARAEATAAEVRTVLAEAGGFLPAEWLRAARVAAQTVGLRALPRCGGHTAAARRGHVIEVGDSGLVSVAGGKLTTHRLIAWDALRRLPLGGLGTRRPDAGRLPGTGWGLGADVRATLDPDIADHLERLYGDETGRLLDLAASVPDGLVRIHPDGPDVWAQVHYAHSNEWASTVDDVAWRRTTLAVRGLLTEEVTHRLAAVGRV
jgi:glycerol-3-phosphate dehydrogenase